MGQNFQPRPAQIKKLRELKDQMRLVSKKRDRMRLGSNAYLSSTNKIESIRAEIGDLVYQFRGLYKKEPEQRENYASGKLRMPRSRSGITGKAVSLVITCAEEDGIGRPVIPS